MIDRTPIPVGTRTVRIRAATTLCSGEGRAVRRNGVRRWRHFTCLYSAFLAGGIHDVRFRVHTLSTRKYLCTPGRWVAGGP